MGDSIVNKSIKRVIRDIQQHWVGDGFPVRSLFSYAGGNQYDPFLLLDYAGPHEFPPSVNKRGVDVHPHKGFETVTILYQGELAHRDSGGGSGKLEPGDVQWMTAGKGVVHEEYHGESFTRQGGMLEMVQLWVNLPAKDKSTSPKYQDLRDSQFPRVRLPADSGVARVIAGQLFGESGPAQTFTPINIWDLELQADANLELDVPFGHNTIAIVQQGAVQFGNEQLEPVQAVLFSRDGDAISLTTNSESRILLLSGKPIDEPVAGHGPFVMNTQEEIQEAIDEFRSGKMGQLT